MDKVSDTPRTDAEFTDDYYVSGFVPTEFAQQLERELAAAQKKINLFACALRALLSKCPNCGGTGEVGTGIIQIGQPAQMPCFVCSGERQILLKECEK